MKESSHKVFINDADFYISLLQADEIRLISSWYISFFTPPQTWRGNVPKPKFGLKTSKNCM